MYQISYDPDRILMSTVQQGFWSMPEFREFEAKFSELHNDIRKRHRNYRVLLDCRNFDIQGPEVSQAFAILAERQGIENKGRCAILVKNMLVKMQAQRTAGSQPDVQFFFDMDPAMIWLFEDGSLPD